MSEQTCLSDEEVAKICSEPDPSTKDFIFQQTMYRIKDPRKSLKFYTNVLGMILLKKLDFPAMKFSLYFMGFENKEDIPSNDKERTEWALSRKATLELTHNWGTETDPEQSYKIGNSDELGVEFVKKPDDGKMKGLAFIKDPDGYWIEIFSAKTAANN